MLNIGGHLKYLRLVLLFLTFIISNFAFADQPEVGKKAAQKYFTPEAAHETSPNAPIGDNVLMLHIGQYMDSQAYNWGPNPAQQGAGGANYGVTYLLDQWHGMDVNFRGDFSEYSLSGNRAVKLSLMPLLIFPRAETKFPLYFGIGAGGGIFLQQLSNASNISFDYELVMGLRFMELAHSTGLFVEFGMKNDVFILSQGQFNGTVLDGGIIFDF